MNYLENYLTKRAKADSPLVFIAEITAKPQNFKFVRPIACHDHFAECNYYGARNHCD